MDPNKKYRECISALIDGALPDTDTELAMAALRAQDGARAWSVFHRIGDVLRAQAAPDLSPDFAARLAARLAAEPAVQRRTAAAAEGTDAPATVAGPR